MFSTCQQVLRWPFRKARTVLSPLGPWGVVSSPVKLTKSDNFYWTIDDLDYLHLATNDAIVSDYSPFFHRVPALLEAR